MSDAGFDYLIILTAGQRFIYLYILYIHLDLYIHHTFVSFSCLSFPPPIILMFAGHWSWRVLMLQWPNLNFVPSMCVLAKRTFFPVERSCRVWLAGSDVRSAKFTYFLASKNPERTGLQKNLSWDWLVATQIFFIFTPIWGRLPFWLIFFRWVGPTTN